MMPRSDERTGLPFALIDVEGGIRADHPLRTTSGLPRRRWLTFQGPQSARHSIRAPWIAAGDVATGFNGNRLERQVLERVDSTCCFAGSATAA